MACHCTWPSFANLIRPTVSCFIISEPDSRNRCACDLELIRSRLSVRSYVEERYTRSIAAMPSPGPPCSVLNVCRFAGLGCLRAFRPTVLHYSECRDWRWMGGEPNICYQLPTIHGCRFCTRLQTLIWSRPEGQHLNVILHFWHQGSAPEILKLIELSQLKQIHSLWNETRLRSR